MWKYAMYAEKYMQEILAMTIENYGTENDISHEDFLRHEYFENPAGDALISLAVDEKSGRLAGQYLIWPMRFSVHGETVSCSNSLNTLTRAEYRGQGIFSCLAEEVYRQAEESGQAFCYGMPNPNSYPGFIKRLSFSELGRLPLLLRPLRPSGIVREFLHSRGLEGAARLFDPLFRVGAGEANGAALYRVNHENLEVMNQFWAAVKGKYPVMNTKDAAFIRFRYLDMPRRTYYPYLVIQDGRPVCFAVGRIMDVAGMRCAMLAEFLFLPGQEAAARFLLNRLLHEMQEEGAVLAGCLMAAHTEEYRFLKRHGFFPCPRRLEPQPFPLVLRLFDEGLAKKGVLDIGNWFFTMGDYDVV